MTLANRPEADATPEIALDLKRQGLQIGEVHVDRAYINSLLVIDVLSRAGEVVAKPWAMPNKGLFTKSDFKIDVVSQTVTCPGGQRISFDFGSSVNFDVDTCSACPLRSKCTTAKQGGRTLQIAHNEDLQVELRSRIQEPEGRQRLRERVKVEHRLAHVGRKQGRRGRYFGVRKNLLDLRRAATLVNLEVIHRQFTQAGEQKAA